MKSDRTCLVYFFVFLVKGGTFITNTTLAYFNNVCDRHDTAIQVGQHNDDGQFPMITSTIWKYNISRGNIIFNGRPNLDAVNSADCVDMDCDGLKKALLIDQDGSLFDWPGSAISQAEYLWGKSIDIEIGFSENQVFILFRESTAWNR